MKTAINGYRETVSYLLRPTSNRRLNRRNHRKLRGKQGSKNATTNQHTDANSLPRTTGFTLSQLRSGWCRIFHSRRIHALNGESQSATSTNYLTVHNTQLTWRGRPLAPPNRSSGISGFAFVCVSFDSSYPFFWWRIEQWFICFGPPLRHRDLISCSKANQRVAFC